MSKILRRPMFRGGPVDSRGTGITSGLGYEAGGRVGYNQGNLVAPLYTANNNLIKGGDLMQKYTSINDILKIMPYNMRGAEIKDKYNFDFPINEKSIFIAENPEAQNIKTTSDGDVYFEENLVKEEGLGLKYTFSGLSILSPELFYDFKLEEKRLWQDILKPASNKNLVTGQIYEGQFENLNTLEDVERLDGLMSEE